jgi:hypothetical protein
MNKKLTWGCVSLIIALLSLAISFYLQCRVFSIVGADNLMWFLLWANLPLTILFSTIANVIMKLYEDTPIS